jgi:hypothetical protein
MSLKFEISGRDRVSLNYEGSLPGPYAARFAQVDQNIVRRENRGIINQLIIIDVVFRVLFPRDYSAEIFL